MTDLSVLGKRERRAMSLRAKGISAKQIALLDGSTPSSVYSTLESAQNKMGCPSIGDAVKAWNGTPNSGNETLWDIVDILKNVIRMGGDGSSRSRKEFKGEQVRAMRKRGLSDYRIAKEMGISREYVGQLGGRRKNG